MDPGLPLSALLSQTLVAFTIEFDNEFEHRIVHRTTRTGSASIVKGPWLTSLAMYASGMRFVGEEGISAADLEKLARMKTNLSGLQRWRYIDIDSDGLIRATRAGRKAREIWAPLFAAIEDRWRERFGSPAIDRLRSALADVVVADPAPLPDFMPILGYGLTNRISIDDDDVPLDAHEADALPLTALLSKTLLRIALGYEARSKLSLAIAANILRLHGEGGVRIRDLPRLSGTSKEAIAMGVGFLERSGYATVANESPGSRVKVSTLTERGERARDGYARLCAAIERGLRERVGSARIDRLRTSLDAVVFRPDGGASPLFAGLTPYPDGWRASVRAPVELPHFPMVLHRGGYPDGS